MPVLFWERCRMPIEARCEKRPPCNQVACASAISWLANRSACERIEVLQNEPNLVWLFKGLAGPIVLVFRRYSSITRERLGLWVLWHSRATGVPVGRRSSSLLRSRPARESVMMLWPQRWAKTQACDYARDDRRSCDVSSRASRSGRRRTCRRKRRSNHRSDRR